jgi:hypothetical protein
MGTNPIVKVFLDGTLSKKFDFEFVIGGQTFHQYWFLVEGIYPEIARIAKTINEPVGKGKKIYATWQQESRKDAESTFGVLRKNF